MIDLSYWVFAVLGVALPPLLYAAGWYTHKKLVPKASPVPQKPIEDILQDPDIKAMYLEVLRTGKPMVMTRISGYQPVVIESMRFSPRGADDIGPGIPIPPAKVDDASNKQIEDNARLLIEKAVLYRDKVRERARATQLECERDEARSQVARLAGKDWTPEL